MSFIFKIRVFDRHEKITWVNGKEKVEPMDGNWYRFDNYIDLNKTQISSFREYVLFTDDEVPIRCVKIYLTDDEYLYGCYSIDKFVEYYNTEYTKLLDEWTSHTGKVAFEAIINSLPKAEEIEEEEEGEDDDKD